jgi:hypothetical protein
MPTPQNFKNHARFDPAFHFFVMPMLLVNFGFSIALLIRHFAQHPHITVWWMVLSVVFFMIAGTARGMALKAQDRIIRLEERLRYQALLGSLDLAESHGLTLRQIIALRFASDAELPGLIKRAVAEQLTPKQIKQSITVWRPDLERV